MTDQPKEKFYKIEKTNYPFIKEVADTSEYPLWNIHCIGMASYNFVQMAVNNSYCQSYYCQAQRGDKSVQLDYNPSSYHEEYMKPEMWDTFNTNKKQKNMGSDFKALMIVFNNYSEEEMTTIFDSVIPLCFKSTKSIANQWLIVNHISEREERRSVPDTLVKATAEYLGATLVVTYQITNDRLSWKAREEMAKECFQQIGSEMRAAILYTDNSRAEMFFNIAKIRYGAIDDVKKLKLDHFVDWEDPMKNSILHIALPNPNVNVFHHLAKQYPELINRKNIFGHTPIHSIHWLYRRFYREPPINWKELWKLPINFSARDENGKSCLEVILEEKFSVPAFTALIENEKRWADARKHHKRKRILTAILHEYLKTSFDEKTMMFFIENGASIHHHEGKSLLNTALRCNRTALAVKLMEIGSKLTTDDIVIAFENKCPDSIRVVVKRPEFNSLSPQQLNRAVQTVINIGLTDILKYLVKKGCKTGLSSINQSAMLTTANLIAQMNRTTVMPLTYLCVDAISESIGTDDEAKKLLETYPEEIRSLFPKKELWRWVLLMDAKDSDRQRRILNLYQASNSAKQLAEMVTLFKVGSVEFTISRSKTNWLVWPGSGEVNSTPCYDMYYEEFYEYIGSSGHADSWSRQDEKGKEVLEKIMKDCGWPIEDKYIFLLIINTCNNYFWYYRNESNMPLVDALFSIWLNRFMKPPEWYTDFILATYGVTNPPVPPLD